MELRGDEGLFLSQNIIETLRESLIILDETLHVVAANRTFYSQFGVPREETEGWLIYELGDGQWKIPGIHHLLEERILVSDVVEGYRVRYRFGAGAERTMVLNARRLERVLGKKALILMAIEDVTSQTRAAEELQRSEEKYRKFVEEVNSIIIGVNRQGRITFFNRFSEKVFGYSREEVKGELFVGKIIPCTDSLGRDNTHICSELFADPAKYYANESEGVRSDGSRIWFSWSAKALYDDSGQVSEVLIDGNDITEIVASRRNLEEKSAQLDTIMEFIPEGIMISDVNNRVVAASNYIGKLLDVDKRRLYGTYENERVRMLDLYWPDGERVRAGDDLPLAKAIDTGLLYENYEMVLKTDGKTRSISVNAAPIYDSDGNVSGGVSAWRDLTEYRVLLEQYERQTQLLQTIIDSIPVMITIHDPQNGEIKTNRSFEQIAGWGGDDIAGGEILEMLFPDPQYREMVSGYMQSSVSGFKDLQIRAKNGETIDSSWAYILLSDARRIGVGLDIRERKAAEKALRENEQRYSALFNNKTFGVAHCRMIVDEMGKPVDYYIIEINDAYTDILGIEKRDIEGRRVTEVFPGIENFYIDFIGKYGKVALEGGDTQFEVDFEYAKKWLYVYVYSPAYAEFVAIFTDITDRKQAEGELRNERELLQTILKTLPVGLFIAGPQGDVLQVNDALNEIWGSEVPKVKEISEAHVYEGYHLDTGRRLEPEQWPLSRAAINGEVVKGEVIDIVRFDGECATIFVNAAPIRNSDGKVIRAVEVNQDITELRRAGEALRMSEEKFRAIFEQAAVGIGRVSFDDARWIDVNSAFCTMLGYSSEKLMVIPWPQLTHPEDIEADLVPFKQMAAGEIAGYSVEKRFIHKSGYHVWARLTLSLVRDTMGNPDYEIAIIEDFTERKRAIDALQQSEERYKARTEELAAANSDLEAFSYSVSHDLRTPLMVIENFSKIILEDYSPVLDEVGQGYLRRIDDGVTKMQQLINDMLSLSRIGRFRLERKDVDLSVLVEERVNELRSLNPERKVSFIIRENVHAFADPRMIHVAVENLLRNAWKFSSKTPQAQIEFGVFEKDAKTVYFVRDNGVGFDSQFAVKIFEPFRRVHKEKEFGGTGVGLSIVQRVIRRHNGTVWAQGEKGKGATFYFTLE